MFHISEAIKLFQFTHDFSNKDVRAQQLESNPLSGRRLAGRLLHYKPDFLVG